MIYLEASLRVTPGKMKELMEVFEKEFLPAFTKSGGKLVGQWTTSIGIAGTVVDLWAYDDLSQMERSREARAKMPEYTVASEHLQPLIAYEETRLLVPTKLSQMK
jgi:NIPSNAP